MLEKLTTEARNPKSMNIDTLPVRERLLLMVEEDAGIPEAIRKEIGSIENAVRLVIQAFQKGGRLIYAGAGTSGRLGILDASECPPTFGVDPGMVRGLIAGGEQAITTAIEGAEDDAEQGADDIASLSVGPDDVVVGIAASGRTPYVIGVLGRAKESGAKTVSLSNNEGSEIGRIADVAIEVVTGPEVITGSTRLKAGTAQKLVLNMISTIAMTGIGKVYGNLMVDVQPTNEKLVRRAKQIIMEAAGVDFETAEEAYEKAGEQVKPAIVMLLLGCPLEEANARLKEAKGFIRETQR
ncbi:N-acetylmuramic acid 6-phosphate etherase [Bhargavaea beijingensis]|uniref:N-acetylmuramic acid 6-phosphate etherase n=1 Tax=Bhargavaea beijingensis TaxID=426756 RepID=A0ABX9ZAU3_9BACL|nr:N-acetylmuramic acid 6-phosphate etherase [Bhargavaea beijingensis]MCW1929412.1 N-acetylmuramic acid 6-phosphate etherase [Bhargavaea beijingensis]RSK29674.1 N-acetylmuramic acid 6-phosphate etherase [Bhargavaea beijingensis]